MAPNNAGGHSQDIAERIRGGTADLSWLTSKDLASKQKLIIEH